MTENSPKIFVVGAPKTGTSTASAMLSQFGFKVSSWPVYRLFTCLQQRDLQTLMDEISTHDAFDDLPWTVLFEVVDKACPGSKFILTIRDERKWIRSMVAYNGIWPDPSRRFLMGLAAPGGYEKEHLAWYRAHNASVMAFFADRPEDLLVVNWENGDGWDEMGRFIGKSRPKGEMPHLKRTNYRSILPRIHFSLAHIIRLARYTRVVDRFYCNNADRFDPAATWDKTDLFSIPEDKKLWKPGIAFRIARRFSSLAND